MRSIPLGAMEKWLLLEQLADAGHYTNWLVVLDRPLQPELVAATLASIRPEFPVHFSTLGVAEDGLGIEARFDGRRPIEDFVEVHDRDLGLKSLLSRLVNDPLDPRTDGFFRCHVALAPTPMLAVQSSHVAGDGYTNGLMRAAFIERYERISCGETPPAGEASPQANPPELGGYRLALRDIQEQIPAARVHDESSRARPLRLRDLRMSQPMPSDARYELRTFRASLDRAAFRAFFARAASIDVSTLSYFGACLAVAADRCFDPWSERDSDFVALNFPHDLRARSGGANRLGNIVFPFAVPLQSVDFESVDRAAARIQAMTEVAKDNWIYYRVFSHRIRAAADTAVPRRLVSRQRLVPEDGQTTLRPLPVFGVTELPHRRTASLGEARVVESYFQSPIVGRRYVDGRAVLSGTVRWHPFFDARIREFFATFMSCVGGGDPDQPVDIEWELT